MKRYKFGGGVTNASDTTENDKKKVKVNSNRKVKSVASLFDEERIQVEDKFKSQKQFDKFINNEAFNKLPAKYQSMVAAGEIALEDAIVLSLDLNQIEPDTAVSSNPNKTFYGLKPGNNSVKTYHEPTYRRIERSRMKWGGVIGGVLGGVGGAFIGNPMLGYQLGSTVGGAIDSNALAKEQEMKARENAERMFEKAITVDGDSSRLYTNQTNGFYGSKGGSMPMLIGDQETEGEIIGLSNNGGKFVGDKHSQGGIEMDFDNDGFSESEVEGDETYNNEKLYSDQLKVSKDYTKLAKSQGFNSKENSTYAEEAEKLLKKLGKYEEKLDSPDTGVRNTAELMISRIENLLNNLFRDQEVRKI